jgi:hypothetical protein
VDTSAVRVVREDIHHKDTKARRTQRIGIWAYGKTQRLLKLPGRKKMLYAPTSAEEERIAKASVDTVSSASYSDQVRFSVLFVPLW